MKRSKKPLYLLLALAMVLTLLPAVTLPAYAANAEELETAIEAVSGLTATVDGNTVTVTGGSSSSPVTLENTLELDIDAEVTVDWQADVTAEFDGGVSIVVLTGAGDFALTSGSVRNTGGGNTISNYSAGAFTVSGGTVSATTGYAIWNNSTGALTVSGTAAVRNNSGGSATICQLSDGTAARIIIEGGTVENLGSGRAISNVSTGDVTVSGGTVSVTTGDAIVNASTGDVNVSGGTVSATTGYAIRNSSTGVVTVSGGTVSATTGNAIFNDSTGAVNVSGGAVSATTGAALYNGSTGVVTVSDTAIVRNSASSATIYQESNGVETDPRIIIEGGTVENLGSGSAIRNGSAGAVNVSGGAVTATAGNAIYNYSTGAVNVSGGAVSVTTGHAIFNDSTGAVNVSGGAVTATESYAIYNYSTGVVTVSDTAVVRNSSGSSATICQFSSGAGIGPRIIIEGGTVENLGSWCVIENDSTGAVNVSGGAVSATTGCAIFNDSTGAVNVSGGVVLGRGTAITYVINRSGGAPFAEAGVTGTAVVVAVPDITSAELDAPTGLMLWKDGAAQTPVTSAKWTKQSGVVGVLVNATVFVPVPGVTIKTAPQASDFTAPSSFVYSGDEKAYTAPSGMTATIYYEGTSGTVYTKSSFAPQNAGSYLVTADVTETADYLPNPDLSIATMIIAKAAAPTGLTLTYNVAENTADSYDFDLTTLLPAIPTGTSFGTIGYAPVITADDDDVLGAINYIQGNTLTLPVNSVAAGNSATISVAVTTQNYNGFTSIITVTTAPATYTATLTPATHTFPAQSAGYAQPEAQIFTVENTGTGKLTNLAAALGASSGFEVSTAISTTSLSPGETATVSVRPKTRLSAGTHTDTLTVMGDNSLSLTASLSFTVNSGSSSSGSGGTPAPSNVISAPTTTSGWKNAADTINKLKDGESFTINMGSTTTVPGDFFENVAGKDVTLSFNMGGGLVWTVNGKSIPDGKDFAALNLGVSTGTGSIPVEVRNIDGSVSEVQLQLSHDGAFPFKLILSVTLDKKNAGYMANLFYYDSETGKLEFKQAVKVGTDGKVSFVFDHASNYLIVVSETSMEPAVWKNPFTDVKSGDWFYDNVQYAFENGLMTGTSDTTFAPNLSLSRAMLVTILYREAGSPEVEDMYAAHMMDVVDGSWYEDAMGWGAKEGIISGYGEGLYGPDDPVTREQLVTILYRYAGEPALTAGQLEFSDAGEVADWAFDAMIWATSEGIVSGKPGNLLDPQGMATRAETAAVLQRFLEK